MQVPSGEIALFGQGVPLFCNTPHFLGNDSISYEHLEANDRGSYYRLTCGIAVGEEDLDLVEGDSYCFALSRVWLRGLDYQESKAKPGWENVLP